MGRSLSGYALIAVSLAAIAAARPLELEESTGPPTWSARMLALVMVVAAMSASLIAWRSQLHSAAALALGGWAVAGGLLARAIASPAGPATETALMPVVGLAAGGAWFALATWSADPGRRASLPPVHRLHVIGVAATVAVSVSIGMRPGVLGDPALVQGLAGLALGGYVYAAFTGLRAWHLLRLPSLGALGVASAATIALVAALISSAALPEIAVWQIEASTLACALIPVLAVIVEQRVRPGLRSLILGLALPDAAQEISRGDPARMHRLLDALQDYDDSLRGHVSRVAALSVRIGMRMRLNASHLREIALAAQLHDVGKIAIPRPILCKPVSLTAEEFEVMKRHPAIGEQIVGRVTDLAVAVRGVGEHHERWDGAGYPRGRAGDSISLTARIVAVADVYDALVSRRAYKDEWSKADAVAEILRGSGSHFDPRVVDELLHVVGETDRVLERTAA